MLSSDRALEQFHPETPKHRGAIMLGRVLAVCVHPFAGWQLLSTSWRVLLFAAYAIAGFVIVLGVLSLASL